MSLFILTSKSTKSQKSFPCTLLVNWASSNRGRGKTNVWAMLTVISWSSCCIQIYWIMKLSSSPQLSMGLTTTPSQPGLLFSLLGPPASDSTLPQFYHFSPAFCLGASLTPQRGMLKKAQHSHVCMLVMQGLDTQGQPPCLSLLRQSAWLLRGSPWD